MENEAKANLQDIEANFNQVEVCSCDELRSATSGRHKMVLDILVDCLAQLTDGGR